MPFDMQCSIKIRQFSSIHKTKRSHFFSFECNNGFLPYAKAITKRFRKMKLSIEEAKRSVVFTEEDDDDELLQLDDENELNKAVKEKQNFILFESNAKTGEIKFNIESVKYFLNTLIQQTIVPYPQKWKIIY